MGSSFDLTINGVNPTSIVTTFIRRTVVLALIMTFCVLYLDIVSAQQSFSGKKKSQQREYTKWTKPINGECGIHQFQCRSGNCVPLSGYCNHDSQCDDNSDEDGCVWPACNNATEHRCKNGQCIIKDLYNNFVYDCADKSDEDKLECKGFQCNDGQCIPTILKCDGEIDCAGIYKEDERDCTDVTKPENPEEVEYLLNELGIDFCKNGRKYSLEFKCQYWTELGYMKTCRDATHLEDCEKYICPGNMWKCPKSYCIPFEVRCDDIKDCAHGEDEFDCARKDNGRITDLEE